jgi:DNA repair protein RadC
MEPTASSSSSSASERVGPRERLAMYGATTLSDADLVAVLLGTGSTTAPVRVVSAQLLERAGGLHALGHCSAHELEGQLGVGATKALRLLAAIELGTRFASRPISRSAVLGSSRDVDAALRPRLRADDREHFIAIPVDARNRPLAEIEVAVGGLNACCVSPADVFRPVVRQAAAGVLFAHNHPSGETVPSEEDALVTQRLVRAGQLLGVQVLDHVIIGHEGYFSFLDAGLLAPDARGPVT